MKIDGTGRIRTPITVRMKLLDNVFHNMIIALERLESFLEYHRKGDAAAEFAATGTVAAGKSRMMKWKSSWSPSSFP